MLYLPEFDLYIDPIARYTSFQHLPLTLYGKPVLRMGKEGVTLATIPVVTPEANRLTSIVDMAFRSDGTSYGTSIFEATGPAAGSLRELLSNVSPEGTSTFVENHLQKHHNWQGTGSIEYKDPMDHTEPYTLKMSFDLKNKFFGRKASHTITPMMPLMAFNWINDPRDESFLEEPKKNFACNAGTYTSILTIQVPKGMILKNLPPTRNIQTPLASYTARYSVKGQTVRIERRFALKTPGPLCTPKMAKPLKQVIQQLNYDTNIPLSFKKVRG